MSYRIHSVVIEIPHGKHVRIHSDRTYQGVTSDGVTWDGSIYNPYGNPPTLVALAIEDLFPTNAEVSA